ncbi:5'-Nucleotidase domain-containing protein [metagenome]|uniref:5'-Nucleotidase domain-containing protein n=1 Tax=metagenome TaxID=256318 RepID=A0A2P2C4S0_9ZZZZ
MSRLSHAALSSLSLALVSTALLATPAGAEPAGTDLVISEVYGAGGNAGAALTHDFIELYNPTTAAISVDGWSVQYRSATGTSATLTNLSGVVPAGEHYLVRESGGTVGAGLPTPDATGNITMSGTNGVVLLVSNTTGVSTVGDLAGSAAVVDAVGYGSTPTTFEGANTGVALTATTSAARGPLGGDTDNNAADFSEAAPTPENSEVVVEPPAEVDATIAEIQGTNTATSPLAGDIATTRGVVTAAYPTGGLNGFYLQTEGTGGTTDQTPGASDAVFVYGSAAVATVEIGDFVEVTGPVSEFAGTTELTPAAADVVQLPGAPAPVTALATAYPTTEASREAHEGELLAPTDRFTVTNTFGINQYAEIGLATGSKPLIQPTDVVDAQDKAAVAAIAADNIARAVTLDDGASINFLSSANQGIALPWLSKANPIRVGAFATLHEPVILEFRNNVWNLQPTAQVTDQGTATASFSNTRLDNVAPQSVGGNLRLATFNVLNYFNTTGTAFETAGGSCTFHEDRAGDPVTDDACTPDGPRGAAEDEDLARQQAKIVTAINGLGSDIVSLEEIENSVKLLGETDRDDALSSLVDALNTAAGSAVWDYAPSPSAADLPALAEQDVIRTAFIYKPASVDLVGASQVLVGASAFANAREPLAQAFKPAGTPASSAFSVIVNHFKSKGSGTPDPDGQGNANVDRVAQAKALSAFATSFAADRGTDAIFLTGDFNSYTEEDPLQVLYAAGYTNLESDTPGETSYSFSGLSGSLDHVLANPAAEAMVTGVDLWDINAGESVAFEYSRFNYNLSEFFDGADPFRASDHNPEIVGLDVPVGPAPVTLNLLGVNDFHGRINASTVKWAGTVEQLTAQGGADSTLLIGAGDLIGASEFASAVAEDQPTIDLFNALGLDASAVGNHEFDKGWADLRDRVIGTDADRNAQWDYLGANVYAQGTQDPVLPEYATFEVEGVTVGVIGAVTEETASLVSPGGITEIDFGDPVEAVNRVAGKLSDGDPGNGEADVIVASFHAGATQGVGSNYAAEVAKGGEFAQMADLVPAVDVIFNGHTHQAYAWDAPIPGGGGTRPIVQTGQYGENVGQVQVTVDPETGEVSAYTARNVARTATADADLVAAYPRVAQVKTIVDAALANAAAVGNVPVGSITGDITRAYSNGSYVNGRWVSPTPRTEDRGAESTLGGLVANALRDGLPAEIGTADLGIVNPGGMRADLTYAGDTAANPANTDGVVTYAEANGVLPFVNNIWTVDLTGAQLKAVLEQQWQPAGASRPFLALGLSDNVRVTQDPSLPVGSRITSILVDDQPVDLSQLYTISTFSFLGTGGDNFFAFTQGSHRDTGLVDRDLWIDYLQDHAAIAPDQARQQVGASGIPGEVLAGDRVSFQLSKLNLTSLGSPENTSVAVYLRTPGASRKVGDFPVSGGVANVSFTAPGDLTGRATVVAVASPSATQVGLPLTASPTTVRATAGPMTYGTDGEVAVTVESDLPATGLVEVRNGDTVIGTATLADGVATVVLPGTSLPVGSNALTVSYLGDTQHSASSTTVRVSVAKATSTTGVTVSPASVPVGNGTVSLAATVSAAGVTPEGFVGLYQGGSLVAVAELVDGEAALTLGPFSTTGTRSYSVRYLGDDFVSGSSANASVEVVRATPTVTARVSPGVIHRNRTRPVVDVVVSAPGIAVTGQVSITADGTTYTRSLSGGQASFTLPAYRTLGAKTIAVAYLGSPLAEAVETTVRVDVVR